MTPTVGRIVYYKNNVKEQAAIITEVWSDRCVNLTVFNGNGNVEYHTSVVRGYGSGQWDWMPYQKAKAEAGDHNSESAEPRPFVEVK